MASLTMAVYNRTVSNFFSFTQNFLMEFCHTGVLLSVRMYNSYYVQFLRISASKSKAVYTSLSLSYIHGF